MFKELEAAVEKVKQLKAESEAASKIAESAAQAYEAAVAEARDAHEALTKFTADIVPGITTKPGRIL